MIGSSENPIKEITKKSQLNHGVIENIFLGTYADLIEFP